MIKAIVKIKDLFLKIKSNNKNSAFTLAEVLITLGIIGVVATMTIPNMITAHKKRVIETSLKKTYADLSNLIRMSEAENGTSDGWDYSLPADKFVSTYFKPYTKLELCDRYNSGKIKPNCFVQNGAFSTWKEQPNEAYAGGIHGPTPKYYWTSGRAIAIRPATYGDTLYIVFIVDVNGGSGHSVMGKDVFDFGVFHNIRNIRGEGAVQVSAVLPYAAQVSFDDSTDRIKSRCKNDWGYACGLLIQRNNWKIPDDYPIKF